MPKIFEDRGALVSPMLQSSYMTDKISRFYPPDAWIEGSAEKQLNDLAASSDAITRIAAMPDLHPGKYGPVGIGMLSKTIHPAIVGSDIGCGMSLFRLDIKHRKLKLERTAERLKELDHPYDEPETIARNVELMGLQPSPYDIGLGNIGGGNHFCELQAIHEVKDPTLARLHGLDPDMVFVLVHSGSRALGYSVFERLMGEGLPQFEADSEDGQRYLREHDAAVNWAFLNRDTIAERAAAAAGGGDVQPIARAPHNYLARVEGGFLHRKGAAPADRGLVPIPGSRESLSYLVAPTECASPNALQSLAHGAGRKYDRGAMHGRIEKTKSMREKMTRNPYGGIVVCEDRALMVEEAGAAYKNIDRVIEALVEQGLCTVVATFKPLITFKTGMAHIGRDKEDRR